VRFARLKQTVVLQMGLRLQERARQLLISQRIKDPVENGAAISTFVLRIGRTRKLTWNAQIVAWQL
jgi:hypothetical protein